MSRSLRMAMKRAIDIKYGPFGNVGIQCVEHKHDVCPICDAPWFEAHAALRGMTVEDFTAQCIQHHAKGFPAVQTWLDETRPAEVTPEPQAAGDS